MILEIRRYEIVPGRRDEFATWFDNTVLPEMEAIGMQIVGQFVSLDDPNVFFYLRSFADEEERERQTQQLYAGKKWQEELAGYAQELETDYHVELVTPTTGSHLR